MKKFLCYVLGHRYKKIGENTAEETYFLQCKDCDNYININNGDTPKHKLYGTAMDNKIKQWFKNLFK